MRRCNKVFVYGSLRRGQRYRPLVEALVTTSREAVTRGRIYHFASHGSRGEFPYMTEEHGSVVGEVLTFRDMTKALQILDRLEDHPALYLRRLVRTRYTDGARGRAWAYFIVPAKAPGGRWVPTGDWVLELGTPEIR